MKFRTYQGETLTNVDVSLKIDGVRAHNVNGQILSRKDKPLYNITMPYDVAEIFTGSWENTVSRVRTHNGTPLEAEYIYCLDPIDPRLDWGTWEHLDSALVNKMFLDARDLGYEGLVLRTDKYWYKVKEQENFDTIVTGIIEGKGKYVGRLGAFVTAQGNVGTGLTDKQREEFFTPDSIGKTIEVETMGLTPKGKFRHPRFIRERFDK
jgi:hypothetical protein